MNKTVTHVTLDPRTKVHTAFFILSIFTCGLAVIPWVVWAVLTKKQNI